MKRYLKHIESRIVRVFVSSTFRDMMPEREHLVKVVFPELRRELKEQMIDFIEIDLRWGITDEEAQSGAVLKLCLDEIEHTRPYFIGILGGRYGWVPNDLDQRASYFIPGMSITEMEFVYGALESNGLIHGAFFLKDENIIALEFKDSQDSDDAQKLEALKEKLRQQNQYPTSTYHSIEYLGASIKAFLLESISKDYALEIDHDTYEHQVHAHYGLSRYNHYVEDYHLNTMSQTYTRWLIGGEKGSGRSTHFTHILNDYAKDDNCYVLFHYCQATLDSSKHENILSRFCSSLYQDFDVNENDLSAHYSYETLFVELLNLAAQKTSKILIAIDGLEYLEDLVQGSTLKFLSLKSLPECVDLLLTNTTHNANVQHKNHDLPLYTIKDLDALTIKQYASRYLLSYGKKMSEPLIDELSKSFKFKTIEMVKAFFDELRVYGHHETLKEHAMGYVQCDSPFDFYDAIINRIEQDYSLKLTYRLLTSLIMTENGLYEYEIRDMFDGVAVKYVGLLSALTPYITLHMGRYAIKNQFLYHAIQRRYGNDPDKMAMMFRNINSYFLEAYTLEAMDMRTLKELCYSFKHADRYPKMIEIFGDIPRFHRLYREDPKSTNYYFEEVYYHLGFIHVLIKNFKDLDPSVYSVNDRMSFAKSILAFSYGYRDLDSALMFGVELIDMFESDIQTFEDTLQFHELAVLISRMLADAGMGYGTQILFEALMFFENQHIDKYLCEAYLTFGDIKLLDKNPNEALDSYKRALDVANHIDDVEGIILSYLKIVQLLANHGNKENAYDLLEETTRIFNTRIALKSPVLIDLQATMGDIYLYLEKNADAALESYTNAIELIKSTTKLSTRKDISLYYKKMIQASQMKNDQELIDKYQNLLDELNAFYAQIETYEGLKNNQS